MYRDIRSFYYEESTVTTAIERCEAIPVKKSQVPSGVFGWEIPKVSHSSAKHALNQWVSNKHLHIDVMVTRTDRRDCGIQLLRISPHTRPYPLVLYGERTLRMVDVKQGQDPHLTRTNQGTAPDLSGVSLNTPEYLKENPPKLSAHTAESIQARWSGRSISTGVTIEGRRGGGVG